ncbi:uncharacterized protein AC631_04324 [Debaryomyces fabryi]|uniref:Protein FMP25, mitochondrial n=1 Tax=Debaryomyces fabryi TaxID=58627 RepID=A0A0V1PUI4_9ASCO|nr:uncharacterized protein AC631_04324 [Debaryomyces fabryi]KRZ99916.1 hypothetical protein AC631_04324 [Debaryomyces fabryi]CUM51969.1 unnamed protein product [Debaryomyces fabryi]
MIRHNLRISKQLYRFTELRNVGVGINGLNFVRFYSDDKFKSIEEFKKQKKDYRFGHNFSSLDELDNQNQKHFTSDKHSDSSNLHEKISQSRYNQLNENDINSIIENDPRLINLKPGSAEYKYQQDLIHREFQQRGKKEQARYEFIERFKGIGLGILALIGIVSIHQIAMNYEYLKNKITHNFNYKFDDSKIKSMDDPSINNKTIDYLTNKLIRELSNDIIADLEKLNEVSGLYVFGSHNKQKLPFRFKFFDGMLIKDVQIFQDYLAVINEKGELYQYYKGLKEPVLTKLGSKVTKCQISNDLVYLLTKNGEVIYTPRMDKSVPKFDHLKSRSLLGISSTKPFNKIDFRNDSKQNLLHRNESIKDISTGQNHILMLSSKGRLFIANTALDPNNFMNYGQFGIPALSPFGENSDQIPNNQAFELTLLNNEVVSNKDGAKSIRPRTFDNIATGKYHNIVADTAGNIWSWGKNTFGECGSEISYKTDFQPVPKKIFTIADFLSFTKNTLPNKLDTHNWSVENVYAADETSYIKLKYSDENNDAENQSVLISFGNGLKGQLGSSRFMHVCPQPQVVKSLNNLSEYNEFLGKVVDIGIKDVSIGNNHGFITLDNTGNYKDVLTFGDNEFGQFGNGKVAKSNKPVRLPKLIEPEDFTNAELEKNDKKSQKKLVRKINDITTNRLQLLDGVKLANGASVEQVIFAGDDSSVIFYKRK